MNSIWNTVECDAWSRDFDYQNYMNIWDLNGKIGTALSLDGYQAFCDFMDNVYEESLK